MTDRWRWIIGVLLAASIVCAMAISSPWLAQHMTPQKLFKIAVEAFVLLPAALFLEAVFVGWEQSSARRLLFKRSNSSTVDLLLYAINEMRLPRLIITPLSFIGMSGIALTGNGVLAEHLGIAHLTSITNPVLGFAVYWLVRDFTFYWLHRGLHSRLFWPLHRLHHSATEMTVICSGRSNVLADLFLNLLLALPLSLFSVPVDCILVAQFAVVFHGFISHSNWASDWGWFGRWVLVSPLQHRMHHGLRPEEYSYNMGTMPLWDHLFGTFAQPSPQPVAIGIDDPAYRSVRGTFAMMLPEIVETLRACRMGKPLARIDGLQD